MQPATDTLLGIHSFIVQVSKKTLRIGWHKIPATLKTTILQKEKPDLKHELSLQNVISMHNCYILLKAA